MRRYRKACARTPTAPGKPVTKEPYCCGWSAPPISRKKGDRLEAFTLRKASWRVIGTRTVQVDFIEKSASGEHRRRGDLQRAPAAGPRSATPVKDEDEEFESPGLRGISTSCSTRRPRLELRGNIKYAGQVTVHSLRAPVEAPQGWQAAHGAADRLPSFFIKAGRSTAPAVCARRPGEETGWGFWRFMDQQGLNGLTEFVPAGDYTSVHACAARRVLGVYALSHTCARALLSHGLRGACMSAAR